MGPVLFFSTRLCIHVNATVLEDCHFALIFSIPILHMHLIYFWIFLCSISLSGFSCTNIKMFLFVETERSDLMFVKAGASHVLFFSEFSWLFLLIEFSYKPNNQLEWHLTET
jgi:hypothetical protein